MRTILTCLLLVLPLAAVAEVQQPSFPEFSDVLLLNETNSTAIYVELERQNSIEGMQAALDALPQEKKIKGAMLRFDPKQVPVDDMRRVAEAIYHCGMPVIYLFDIARQYPRAEVANNPYLFALGRMPRHGIYLRMLDLNELLLMSPGEHSPDHPPLPSPIAAILSSIGIVLLAAASYIAGLRISRLKAPWWVAGYLVPVLLTLIVAVARWFPTLEMRLPFSLLMHERREYVVMAIATALLLAVPVARLKRKTTATLTTAFAALFVVHFSLLPFLLPVLNSGELMSLPTTYDRYGVCMQNTGYTCGPAAAVSALSVFDINAEEGELAVFAHSTSSAGTPPELLSRAIVHLYGEQGVSCMFRRFESIEEMKQSLPVIAVVKFGFLVDHFVTVVRITDGYITVADPAKGLRIMSHDNFEKEWRHQGVVVQIAGDH